MSDYEKGIEAAIEGGLVDGLTHVAWVPFEVWMSDRIGRFLACQPEAQVCITHKCGALDEYCEQAEACYLVSSRDDCEFVKARLVVKP